MDEDKAPVGEEAPEEVEETVDKNVGSIHRGIILGINVISTPRIKHPPIHITSDQTTTAPTQEIRAAGLEARTKAEEDLGRYVNVHAQTKSLWRRSVRS